MRDLSNQGVGDSTEDPSVDVVLLDRYMTNPADAEARAAVDRWIAGNPTRREWVRQLESGSASGAGMTAAEARTWFDNMRERAAHDRASRADTESPRAGLFQPSSAHTQRRQSNIGGATSPRVPRWIQRVAGPKIVVPVAGLAIAMLALVFLPRKHPAHTATARTYTTGSGQQAHVTLRDGSDVLLAQNTTFEIVDDGVRSRTVILRSGEAYFNVMNAAGTPFTVQSGGFVTQVLGTTFLVRYGNGERRVHVSVASGKVRVSSSASVGAVTVTSGNMAEITDSTAQVNAVDELAPKTEWSHGKLGFHDMQIGAVLQTLGRWYGYEFRCPDSTLFRQKVNIIVSMQSSSAALATLEEILGVNLNVVGDTVTLIPQAASRAKHLPREKNYDTWTPSREVGR